MIAASRLAVVPLALVAMLGGGAACGSGNSSASSPGPSPSGIPSPVPTVVPAPTPPPLAAGELDPSFGDGGIVRGALTNLYGAPRLLLLPDGRLLIAAVVVDTGLVLARFLGDGRADPSFGDGGRMLAFARSKMFALHDLEPSGDGGIVFAANVDGHPALMRTTGDGVLDPSFGAGGVAIDARPSAPLASGLARDTSGRLITAGVDGTVATVARYRSDGAPDTAFGDGGLARSAPVEGARCHFNTVAVQASGHIVAGGSCDVLRVGSEPLLARFEPDGSGEPELLLPFAGAPRVRGVSEILGLDDGRLFLAVFDQPPIVSLTSEGAGREDFGTHGLSGDLPGATVVALAVDDAERTVAAGFHVADASNAHDELAVGRFTADGVPDVSFGDGGLVVTPFEASGIAQGVAIQDDGAIVILAEVGTEAVLLRYSSVGPGFP